MIALGLAACGPRTVLGHGRTGGPGRPDAIGGGRTEGSGKTDGDDDGAQLHGVSAAAGDEVRMVQAPAGDEVRVVSAAAGNGGVSAAGDERRNGVVISRLPAPHRSTVATAFTPADAAAARALVGHRDARTGLAFAIDVAAAFTGAAAPAVEDGEGLVRWAQERGLWTAIVPGVRPSEGALRMGDLIVFDRAEGGKAASLVAVVLGTDARGVTDVMYVARGVVRRGYVDVARPTVARDREGRVVNSYVRHGSDYPPPGTRYLAGELAGGRVRIR